MTNYNSTGQMAPEQEMYMGTCFPTATFMTAGVQATEHQQCAHTPVIVRHS